MTEYRPRWRMVVAGTAMLAIIAVAAIVAWNAKSLLAGVPVVLGAGAASGFVGIAWFVFEKYAWKVEFQGKRVLASVAPQPNFNGRWEGVLKSPHLAEAMPLVLEVRQSFTHIDCQMWTASNRSHSVCTSLLCSPDDTNFRLLYNYLAQAQPGRESDGHRHGGAVILELVGNDVHLGSRLRGTYFTDRDIPEGSSVRCTRGHVFLEFKGRRLHGQLGDMKPESFSHLLQ